LLDPEAQNFTVAVRRHAEGDVDGLLGDRAVVAHVDEERVDVDDRVDRIERP